MSAFFKRASDWIQGVRYYWEPYLIIWTTRSIHSQVLKNLFNDGELYEIDFLGIWKKCLVVSFWAPLKGCFWIFQRQGHRFYKVLYFLFLTCLVWRHLPFWAPLKGCFWIFQRQGHRFYNVLYFLFLTCLVWRQNVQKQLFAAVFQNSCS